MKRGGATPSSEERPSPRDTSFRLRLRTGVDADPEAGAAPLDYRNTLVAP